MLEVIDVTSLLNKEKGDNWIDSILTWRNFNKKSTELSKSWFQCHLNYMFDVKYNFILE